MKVIIWWDSDESSRLHTQVQLVLDELGLTGFVTIDTNCDTWLQKDLGIQKDPALVIEEESIDFKDMIFEGMIPPEEELKSMFFSIIGGNTWGWGNCSPEGCGSGCSC